MSPQRKYAILGALGGFLFCVGAALLVRSCELRQMRATVGAIADVFLPPSECTATEAEIRVACAALGVTYR